MKIDLSYGSGGKETGSLIDVFIKYFNNPIIKKMEDAAVLSVSPDIVFTTDSFVVTPLFFSGGDIGKLAVCGTVNDLLMMGAMPKYLTTGFIIEAGAETGTLEKIAESMSKAAKEAGVFIVAGDTKVIEGSGGIYINTSGIGEIIKKDISISNCKSGDAIIISGNLGEHHAAIYSERMQIENNIKSDCAPLKDIVINLLQNGIDVHTMRDVTRGGLATVLNEMASSSDCGIEIQEDAIPVSEEVNGFCNILGLDPLYMANEGKLTAVVPENQAEKALEIIKKSKYGENAKIIGHVTVNKGVTMLTRLGGRRQINMLYGEGLPRIC